MHVSIWRGSRLFRLLAFMTVFVFIISSLAAIPVSANSNSPSFTITINHSGDGRVNYSSTNGSQFNSLIVTPDSSHTFFIRPGEGHIVTNVLVDGVPLGPVSQYTFRDIHGNHTLVVVFDGDEDTCKVPTTNPTSSQPPPPGNKMERMIMITILIFGRNFGDGLVTKDLLSVVPKIF